MITGVLLLLVFVLVCAACWHNKTVKLGARSDRVWPNPDGRKASAKYGEKPPANTPCSGKARAQLQQG